MAQSVASSSSSKSFQASGGERDDEAYLAGLAAQRNANAFFEKYDRRDLQELLSLTSCSWLLCCEDNNLPAELPTGIIKQMKNFSFPNAVILAPVDPRVSLDYKDVHQIVRELVIGIYCFNQIPFLSLEPNYDQSTSCQLTPAYYDTKVGQILISVDYMVKALWHGALIPKEKRVRFSELWRSSMDVDASGVPHTKKDIYAEFLTAGLMDISEDASYQGIYSEVINVDPTYDPNSPEEEKLFSQHSESILLKLSPYLCSVKQHENLFVFEGTYNLSNVVRLAEDKVDLSTYQRLEQRLRLHERLVGNCLERKMEMRKNMAYLKLIAFLVPFLIGLKKKMKIPDLAKLLPSFSDDKLKTERELPPLLLGPDFTCKHFKYKQNEYFHLHGSIEFDIGTPGVEDIPSEIKDAFEDLQSSASDHLSGLLAHGVPYREHYPLPVRQFEGRSYYVISIEIGMLYQQLGRIQWWEAMNDSIKALKAKRLPLNDTQLHEQFKKTFGYKKAIKCKSLPLGLKAAAERGLVAVFQTLCRRNPVSRLRFLDEQGYSLLHHAALHNQAPIICQLAMAGLSLNQRRSDRFIRAVKSLTIGEPLRERTGPTPLHLAAQCGSLDALNCLLALQADYKLVDRRGWAAVHFAAFYGNVTCVQALYRKDPAVLELETTAEYRCTPLLLVATSGSVEALNYLLSIGANWKRKDSQGNNVVQLAALYFHTESLRHLIELNLEELPVWKLLVEMLQSEEYAKKEMAARCLEVLCVATDSFWKDIMDAGGIPALMALLCSGRQTLQCVAAAVVCNMSEREAVSRGLVECGAVPVLVQLLHSPLPELQSRCTVILADLALCSSEYQALIAQLGGIVPVVQLLGSDLEDVLISVVNCVRALCLHSTANQSAVVKEGGIPPLVEFLTIKSDVLQAASSAALAELARGHRQNQDAICAAGAIGPLVNIIRGRKMAVQVKAAVALEALADHNAAIQAEFLKKSVSKHLLRLLKVFQLEVREQGAVSIWALAGQTLKQQKMIADLIGYHFILDLLYSSSDKMQFVGCQAVIALSRDSRAHQNGICDENGVSPLVRLLRNPRTTECTLLSVIQALGTMCIGVAHTNNPYSQKTIAEEKAIPILTELLKQHRSLQVKVRVAQTLACVVLGNTELQTALWNEGTFTYSIVLEMLHSQDQICLEAGYALSLFAFNNTVQQFMILQKGGIEMAIYEPFLQSEDEFERAKAAFQIVILAKVITGIDQVTLSARGIGLLVQVLQSQNSRAVILTAQLLASLAHTRAGIPDAIVTMGAINHLCTHLYSNEEEVRIGCAIALGYLTFNRPAHRILLVECRNTPGLYDLLIEHLSKDAKISQVFTAEFERQKLVGLPSLSLEINGGPAVSHHNNKDRPKTMSTIRNYTDAQNTQCLRTRSAPVLLVHRRRTANTKLRTAEVPLHRSFQTLER
ncbi:ankyrin and armadillo repeat-containing protein isoform X2 [Lepisosteus oculatus]|uniref:ankyrin and armadillo repeat-containing protein isoform X2 n=1 Tax=Lepisosteus oculatus TaxID=7918 RepID=UPI0035F51358